MTHGTTNSGIGTVGDVPWGTHFCHFYQGKEDLLDILVPFFKAGLEQHEFCIWALSGPLDKKEAAGALEHALPGVHARMVAGDIEIVPQFQRRGGSYAPRQLVRAWAAKLDKALANGYAGMRVNANVTWLAEKGCLDPHAYEDEFTGLIANRRMILLCAYPLAVNHSAEVFDAPCIHRFAIARRDGNWQVVETPELRQARATIRSLTAELERRSIERAGELAIAGAGWIQQAAACHRLEDALRACGERSLCYFELGLVGMAILSPAGEFIEANARLCDMLGYEHREFMTMSWARLTHPDDLAGDRGDYERIRAGETEGYLKAKWWVHRNGNFIHTNVSVKAHRRGDGSIDYFAAMIEEMFRGEATPEHQPLSQREREVAGLIGGGRTVKDVAGLLALSEKTVSTYRTRILTKLKLKGTAELIRYVLKHRLAE